MTLTYQYEYAICAYASGSAALLGLAAPCALSCQPPDTGRFVKNGRSNVYNSCRKPRLSPGV